ncbi:redoxin [Cellulomonas sp. WB94]|uniref:peroxiredoxin family protein n=1 Tax=Cellulomonas sp. WB94 TaxID=2173174 RepID=UPI000D57AC43|nr:redoxin domain-containing protein [Cellulomonas sp. WB94]PVU83815.1 redoxin [Cellulomonas sp. WB94]
MTSGTAMRREHERQVALDLAAEQSHAATLRRRRWGIIAWTTGLLVVVGLVVAGLVSARPTQSAEARTAPAFTLPATDGTSVSLASLRGTPVLLYFSEGAGCDACLVQMAKIESDPAFTATGIKVLPIVMNTAAQITPDMTRLRVTTPFLLDDGTTSKAYDTLGKGMHEGLPGHGFVLIDAQGVQKWSADYPSMWIAPADLLKEVTARL